MQNSVDTACTTVIIGVVVFVVGQLISRFVFEPWVELKRTIEKIDQSLSFYAQVYANVGSINQDLAREASREIRKLAFVLRANARNISGYGILEFFKFVKDRRTIIRASEILTGLSNSMFTFQSDCSMNTCRENVERADEVVKLLGTIDFWA